MACMGGYSHMEDEEIIYADTSYTLSLKDMADALDKISTPTQIADTPLPFDPDDYPVTVTPPETRTHRLWRILAFIIEALVIAAILGIWVAFIVWLFVFASGGGQ